MADDKLKLLAGVPLFARCGRKDLEQIGQLTEEIDAAAGKVLMREGEIGQEFFLIVSGKVRIERAGKLLRTLGPGDFTGEIALVQEELRTATATCETDCRLLVIGHREFHSMLDQHPDFRRSVMSALADRVRRLEPEMAE
ncbi:MAG TPA: cyclic nucleotide-binding domain-containing protein [Candidatus Limnocylindrales bacterium]